jgi:hypothetical protein
VEFDVGLHTRGLDKNYPVVKKGFKIAAAFDCNILYFIQSGNGELLIQNTGEIYVDNPFIGDDPYVEIPVYERKPDVTYDKDEQKYVDNKKLGRTQEAGDKWIHDKQEH